jgi:hypothetical protein
MVGSNPRAFKALADSSEMPAFRQNSCKADYIAALYSWGKALKPYLRSPAQPKIAISVIYGDSKGALDIYARSFRKLKFLEAIVDYLSDVYVWPRPLVLEMTSCNGRADARWISSQQKIIICYEMVADVANLYRDYSDDLARATQARGDIK